MAGTPITSGRPVGKPRVYARTSSAVAEISMDPRNLDPSAHHVNFGPPKNANQRRNEINAQSTSCPQVDVSTQVDLHVANTIHSEWERLATPLYSREDIKEQYCITSRQLDAVERSSGGIFGCLSTRGPSPCAVGSKVSILSACVRSASSDENICDAPYPRKPLQILHTQPCPSNILRGITTTSSRYDHATSDSTRDEDDDDDEWVKSSYFRRRPTSFCTTSDPKRYSWLPEDEESSKMEGPRPILPSAVHVPQQQTGGGHKGPKHVSFARSHTLTSFDVPLSKSPPRTSHNQERLIDSQPTLQSSMTTTFPPGAIHPYPVPAQPEPRVLVLEKATKRGGMKTQATQTEIPAGFRRVAPVTLSPRTIQRVKMVSQGAQTNGFLNGRKLTKSYSEAGQLGTPLGGAGAATGVPTGGSGVPGTGSEPGIEHEPLQRTQSEEPPRSPFMVDTPPHDSPKQIGRFSTLNNKRTSNGDEMEDGRRSLENLWRPTEPAKKPRDLESMDDQEILIDFKPAPISPDARKAILATLDNEPQPRRTINHLHKTLSDGEIRVERRELVEETGEPSYPHSCKRNYEDPYWGRTVTFRPPVQFSSTPDNLSMLARITTNQHDNRERRDHHRQRQHHEEEFHENIIRRGLFRKRSVSLEDGVQDLQSNEFTLPRSLPTSPTSPTSSPVAGETCIVHLSPKYERIRPSFLRTNTIIVGTPSSPFASSDSLTNDVTKDHSDGIWNESQATVLQVDSLGLLTPSSRRRHLLLLQHQQRSSMDTEALDAEDEEEVDICPPASPRIRLEPASPVILTPGSMEGSLLSCQGANGSARVRSGLRRPSPSSLSQPLSQSSSELALSLARTDSGGRTNTDLSEASTTEDYVTANTSTGTGTTTGTSATTSSWSKPAYLPSSAAPSGPASTTATAADGSSFESASSIYSLARSEAVVEEPCSPPPIIEELSGITDQNDICLEPRAPSPAGSTSSSSSGSYDLEDAMPEPPLNQHEIYKPAAAVLSHHGSELELDHDDGHHSSSGGYAESPPDPQAWTEEERRRRKKNFTLDFPVGHESDEKELDQRVIQQQQQQQQQQKLQQQQQQQQMGLPENVDVSPTPSHRHRPARGKLNAARSPHRNNKLRRDSSQLQLSGRSPGSSSVVIQKDEWINSVVDDAVQVPTSDDSSCSHHYHMHHHHHHLHNQQQEGGRHRRTRESPRRKGAGSGHAISGRRRSNEDKNAALTGSLPRRRSRATVEDITTCRLSPGGRYQRSPGHATAAIIVKSPSPESRLKALSAESLRSVSPGSDSVFYSETADLSGAGLTTLIDAPHCQNCGRDVPEEIVQPPAGFADSPEGPRVATSSTSSSKHVSHRLYKKFDKRYRSEDRGERRYHSRSNGAGGRADVRAKSEERAGRSSSRGSIDDSSRRSRHARSTDASMEVLTGREDEDTYVEPYTGCEWIYIGEIEESHVWRRPDSRDGDDESSDAAVKEQRRGSQGSTESEKSFRKKYQAATHRMVHRKSSGEMYKRIQTKSFESDKRVVVRREMGGEFGFRIHGSKPVVVSAIEPDTPAESSGLEVGDIIMSVNGRSVMDATHSEVVRLAHSGPDVLELEVARTCNVLAPRVSGTTGNGSVANIVGTNSGNNNAIGGTTKGPAKEAPICSGYLWRKATTATASGTEKWVRRWFALRRDNCLYYYKTDTDSQPVGAVMLLKYEVEPTPEATRPYSFAIRKHGAPSHFLAADSEESAARWSTVIREAVERNNQADTWLDASLRMQEVAACAIQRPDCFGYLSKQQNRARKTSSPTGWSRRYCVLKDAALYFYDDANAEKAFGVACLHGFRVHGSAPNSGGRKHAFELQPPDPTQRSYTFATESEMDKKRWLAALEYSIDRWIKVG